MIRKIGLTGGIGSGKSTVAKVLLKYGCHLIDADVISRQTTQIGGAAMPAIQAAFGESFISTDGALNRDAMRQFMLKDANAKTTLEAILHPLIEEKISQQLSFARDSQAQVAVLDIPLLAEAGLRWRHRLDEVWVVDCLPKTQIERVLARSAWPLAQVEAVMAAQASRDSRLACADAVIFNDGISFDMLERETAALFRSQNLMICG